MFVCRQPTPSDREGKRTFLNLQSSGIKHPLGQMAVARRRRFHNPVFVLFVWSYTRFEGDRRSRFTTGGIKECEICFNYCRASNFPLVEVPFWEALRVWVRRRPPGRRGSASGHSRTSNTRE